jgi:hypothetical protein
MLKLLLVAFVAAVPGCIPEVPIIGDLAVYNRTDEAIEVNSPDSLEGEVVDPCSERTFESVRLNDVRIAQQGSNGAILDAPADPDTPQVLLVTSGGVELRTDVPDPLPDCGGRLP